MNNQFSGRIENPQVIEELIADKNSNKLFVFGANWCPDAMNLLQKLNDKSVKKILGRGKSLNRGLPLFFQLTATLNLCPIYRKK